MSRNVPAKAPKTPKRESSLSAGEQPARILVIDIGGTSVKILATGQTERRKMASGTKLTPSQFIEGVQELTRDWHFDGVTIGFPGLVGAAGPRSEPGHLGPGWVGFDFAAAFNCPVRIMNDAAM